MKDVPLNIGHRGACGEAPENTMASFELALEQGAEMVELDVRLSRDGVPVVIHDHSLGRTTSGRGLVALTRWSRLQTLDAGSWFHRRFAGEPIPELTSCLTRLTPRVGVNVEIKCFFGNPEKLVQATAESIRRARAERRVLVTSFNHKAVERFHELLPQVAVGRLFHPLANGKPRARDLAWLEAHRPEGDLPFAGRALVVEQAQADARLAESVAERGGSLLAYTVNDEKEMRRLIGCRIDGLITNFPARLGSLLATA